MTRVMIIDDHAIVREGLIRILKKNGALKVVSDHANGASALQWIRGNDCDVALLDISMPGMSGVDLLKQLREEKPGLAVLVISIYPEDQYAVRLIRAGAAGYLTKESAPAVVVEAVLRVASGKKYISPAVAEMLADDLGSPEGKLAHATLSNREYQILLLLASAKTVAEISDMLALSPKTVSTYRSRILEKMHLRNNAELMRYAVEHRLAQLSQ